MPHVAMLHEEAPDEKMKAEIGDISGFEIFNNRVLIGIYVRPKVTKGGILLTDAHVDEDKFQSKIGLVLKMGTSAFNDPKGRWFNGVHVREGDWVVYRCSDGWPISVNKKECRLLEDIHVCGKVDHPDRVW